MNLANNSYNILKEKLDEITKQKNVDKSEKKGYERLEINDD